jgi:hypothetical protein
VVPEGMLCGGSGKVRMSAGLKRIGLDGDK